MKEFHISDVLSITTGRLVSNRHVEGVYDILNYMIDDDLYTHALPRACDECKPQLKADYPQLFEDNAEMQRLLAELTATCEKEGITKEERWKAADTFITNVMATFSLPEMLQVKKLSEGEHKYINPIVEAASMMQKGK